MDFVNLAGFEHNQARMINNLAKSEHNLADLTRNLAEFTHNLAEFTFGQQTTHFTHKLKRHSKNCFECDAFLRYTNESI